MENVQRLTIYCRCTETRETFYAIYLNDVKEKCKD